MNLTVIANTILLDPYGCGPGIGDSEYSGFGQ